MGPRRTTRRSALRGAAVAGIAGLAGCTSLLGGGSTEAMQGSESVVEGGHPTYRRDPSRTGHAPGLSVAAGAPTETWTFEADGELSGNPTVADGTVYVGDRVGRVYAVSTGDGTEQWRFSTGGRIVAGATVTGSAVYVASHDNTVYAVERSSGNERWSFGTDNRVEDSPVVADGTVYVGGIDGNLYAIAAGSGDEQWRFSPSGWMSFGAALDGETLYVGSYKAFENKPTVEGNLYGVDAVTGDQQWRYRLDADVWTPVAFRDGTAYVGDTRGTVYAVAEDGTERWRTGIDGRPDGSPAVTADTVYVGGRNAFHALDPATGDEQWSAPRGVTIDPLVTGDAVLTGSLSLAALDPASGDVLWEGGPGSVLSTPVVDGTAYVAEGTTLHAVSLA